MPRIFVGTVGARFGLSSPSGDLEFGSARTQPLLDHPIFDGVHGRSTKAATAVVPSHYVVRREFENPFRHCVERVPKGRAYRAQRFVFANVFCKA
jgi:hypothetical protein